MNYSRRQLYAMGEPLGDGATRRELGGKIIYGGGGGGKAAAPEPTTTITESEPTVTSINRTTTNEIPAYLTNASQDLIARGQALTSRPYEAYTGARVAEFTPQMQQAFDRMGGQQVAGQIGQASGLAGLAGQRASDYGMFQQGVQQYMNPYMQNVVDVERRKAQEASDRQAAQLSGQAAMQGAFGGSGAALQQRALRRDTAQQLADIQTQGLGRAYESATNQYNQGISSMLGAAGQLGGLGQQQFGQEMDITQGLGTAGDVQRQRQQALMDVKYGDYLTAQKYPYEQLAFQQGLVAGVPYSTTQRTSGQDVTTPGKQVAQQVTTPKQADTTSQLVGAGLTAYGMSQNSMDQGTGGNAKGGEIKRYADGGVTSLLSDQQLEQRQQMPNITELARMSLDAEAQRRAQLRLAAEGAQDAQLGAQQPTVADEEMAMIDQGLGGLPAGDMDFAEGGIVGFLEGGATEEATSPFGDFFRGMRGIAAVDPKLASLRDRQVAAKQGLFEALTPTQKKARAEELRAVEREIAALQSGVSAPAAPADAGLGSLIMNDERRKRAPGQMAAAEQVAEQAGAAAPAAGIAAAPKVAAPMGPGPAPAAATGGIEALLQAEAERQRGAETEASDIEKAALAADREAQQAAVDEAGKFGSDREERLKKREEGMKGEKDRSFNMALIEAGLAIMAGQSPNALLNIAQGAQQGLKGYQSRLEKISASKEKLDEDFARLYEIRQEKVGAAGEKLRELNRAEAQLAANTKRNLSSITSGLAGKQIELKQKDADRAFDVWKVRQENARATAGRGGDKPFDYRDSYADYIKSLAGKTDQLGRPVSPPTFAEYVAQFALPTMGAGTTSTLPKGATVLPR